jgi:hypothetical protein
MSIFQKPLYAALAGFVIGLLIGLPILGWGLWPVKWFDAAPADLRADLQQDYLRMTIESYMINGDADLARTRFNDLGANKATVLEQLVQNPGKINPMQIQGFKTLIEQTGTTIPAGTTPQPTTTTPTEAGGTSLILVLCIVLLVVGGFAAWWFLFRQRFGPAKPTVYSEAAEMNRQATRTDYESQGIQVVGQFMTTYKLGTDLYDDSFSIDSSNGEFLGECGVGISETIGVGDPKKVTAFEVWLFDKNDIQTVTKVLMSEHAFNDPAILQKLASKGEPVQVGPDKRILLETATLQLEARVVDVIYGQGALPPNSFFERLTLELAVWPKPQM